MIHCDFGPETVRLDRSIVFEKFLSDHNTTIDQEKAEIICRAILQLQGIKKSKFLLDQIRGSTFDTWNLYVDGKNVFCISESKSGYTLRFFDDLDTDGWMNDFCDLAKYHASIFGRYS